MSTVRRIVLAVVVLVPLAGLAGVGLYMSQTPPVLSDHRAGVVRLVPRLAIPPIPNQEVILADGSKVLLSVADITADRGPARAQIGIRALPSGTEEHFYLTPSQHRTTQGVQIELLHVWVMPDASNSAADVRVTPATSK
jgi:hypothetical protein